MKRFLLRGLVFGGFGPVVVGIVLFFVSLGVDTVSLSGRDILLANFSSYLLAFLHAGASVFTGIEHWSLGKILFFHFLTLYSAYSICYLVNEWIPFEPIAFLFFSVVFVAFYALVWCTVVICVKLMERRLNRRLKKK